MDGGGGPLVVFRPTAIVSASAVPCVQMYTTYQTEGRSAGQEKDWCHLMVQHSHFHPPCQFVAQTDPYSRRKQMLHYNSRVELAVGLCPEVEGSCLDCIRPGLVEEHIDHLVQRIEAVADTGSALCRVVEGSQGLVGSTLAQHRTLPALRQVER
jgi:hypothetical protein